MDCSDSGGIRKIGDNQYSVRLLIKYYHSLQNSYLLSQTSRRVLLAAGFRLNQIVSWFLSAMILYFPRSLISLPRKLRQQRRTIHHAKIDERKKPFLLNSSCYGQITPQATVGKHAQYQPNYLPVHRRAHDGPMVFLSEWSDITHEIFWRTAKCKQIQRKKQLNVNKSLDSTKGSVAFPIFFAAATLL